MQSAEQFGMLDSRKSPPILRLFLVNMEIIQALLGEIESKLVTTGQSEQVKKLEDQAKDLQKKIAEFSQLVTNRNKLTPPAEDFADVTFNSASIKGNLQLSNNNKSIIKNTDGHSCVSSMEPLKGSVTIRLTDARENAKGWTLFAVHSAPIANSESSYGEPQCYGWNTTTDGSNSHRRMPGANEKVLWSLTTGQQVTLTLVDQQLTIKGPQWEGTMTLPGGKWYFHINAYSASVTIV